MNYKQLLVFVFTIGLLGSCAEPKYIALTDTIENVSIQPKEALAIAEPYLEEHATYNWNPEKELKTHIVKYKKWYYIMRTNYPAKTLRYYMQPAVKVNCTDGSVSFAKAE